MGIRSPRSVLTLASSLGFLLAAPAAMADFGSTGDIESYDSPDTGVLASTTLTGKPAASLTSSATLTVSPAADPTLSPIKVGTSGDGIPDLIYNPSTGDINFTKDGYASTVVEVLLHSDSGSLIVSNFNTSTGATANPNTLDVQSGNGFSTYDFGNVLAAGLTAQQVVNILSPYTASDDPSGLGPSGLYIVNDGNEHFYNVVLAPEPASLSLIGLTAAGFLSRKRRRA